MDSSLQKTLSANVTIKSQENQKALRSNI